MEASFFSAYHWTHRLWWQHLSVTAERCCGIYTGDGSVSCSALCRSDWFHPNGGKFKCFPKTKIFLRKLELPIFSSCYLISLCPQNVTRRSAAFTKENIQYRRQLVWSTGCCTPPPPHLYAWRRQVEIIWTLDIQDSEILIVLTRARKKEEKLQLFPRIQQTPSSPPVGKFPFYSVKGRVTRWIFFEGLYILISTFCVCTNFYNDYWNPPQSSLLCDCLMSGDLSLASRNMRKNWSVTGGFRYDFTESQAASCTHFQCQNRRFRVFEAGYWKDFQNKYVDSEE